MSALHLWRKATDSGLAIPIVLAAARIALHLLTNNNYGFHRDELATLDDARYLAWGYVAYPPLTPAIGRVALELMGPSPAGIRLFSGLAQGLAVVLAALMARALGGKRTAQLLAAAAVAVAPVSFGSGALFQYVSFDYLWWVAIAWMAVRLLQSEDPRWWVGIGAAIGLGAMTKYTIAFLVAGLAAGVLLTPARRYLRSRWLWLGAALAVAIFLPNLIWQAQHGFISLDFLKSIHARDVRIGRTDGFLPRQFLAGANPCTAPLWMAGLWFFFVAPAGRRYRPIGWMYAVPLLLFALAKGRDYYMAPAYPMLLAGGSVLAERGFAALSPGWARVARVFAAGTIAAGGALVAVIVLPLAPVNSPLWNSAVKINGDLKEEIGWPELAGTVAAVRDALPAEERARLGILAGNYGEAGAIDLYGPALGLPRAISGINSYWLRGYGDPPPQIVIALGLSREILERNFEECSLAGQVTNRFGVQNEETTRHKEIFVCRRLRQPWPEFWKTFRYYG
jgi:hypothetical protein